MLRDERCLRAPSHLTKRDIDVALEVDWIGVPAVDLGPMKAGVQVTMRGASFITIEDGRLARIVDLS